MLKAYTLAGQIQFKYTPMNWFVLSEIAFDLFCVQQQRASKIKDKIFV